MSKDYSHLSNRQLSEAILEMLTRIEENTRKRVDIKQKSKFTKCSTNKIPIDDFCKLENKKRTQVYKLFRKYPLLKARVIGEKTSRVNMDEWEIIKSKS